jgi:hypothetical protein
MRDLHGVLGIEIGDVDHLKAHALLFDKFRFFSFSRRRDFPYTIPEEHLANFSFLCERGVLEFVNEDFLQGWKNQDDLTKELSNFDTVIKAMTKPRDPGLLMHYGNDLFSRMLALHIGKSSTALTVPICRGDLPIEVVNDQLFSSSETVLRVALQAFPVPGKDASWQDILDFREEARNKQWGFRRFLRDLAGKKLSEAEIKDDIEWSANEYGGAMKRFKLKQRPGFITSYVVPLVEAVERLKPSLLIKGLVSINQSKVALLEAEAHAKGRECAYIYDVQKRFGQ